MTMPFERRIGERFDVGDIPVTWRSPRPLKLTRAQRRALDPAVRDRGYVRNVSMSGAAVLAAANPALGAGSTVEVHLDRDRWFQARIRRVLASSDPAWAYYGVVYVQVSEAFQLWLNTLVNRRRAELTETVWRHAE
jgi:hypothetical protein